jgi:hypothetical protein
MKSWDAPVYGFYMPIPDIIYHNGRRSHVFKCAAVGCGTKVRRYLDTNDRGSTSNLRLHAKRCWGDEAFNKANELKDVAKVREAVGKARNSPNGNIEAMFTKSEGSGAVRYMHRQHTTKEARYEYLPDERMTMLIALCCKGGNRQVGSGIYASLLDCRGSRIPYVDEDWSSYVSHTFCCDSFSGCQARLRENETANCEDVASE